MSVPVQKTVAAAKATLPPYQMTLSLNVLEHLGLNLYSNTPAVLSEVVANAWDADAEKVEIWLDKEKDQVTVRDNGHGMTRSEVNERFLKVGFRRRQVTDLRVTPKHKRPVMGRKGIGKLSLFSVANIIEVYTCKDGEKSAFRLDVEAIREKVKADEEAAELARAQGREPDPTPPYAPVPIDFEKVPKHLGGAGTCIVISHFKKDLSKSGAFLRRKLARRFAIIGSANRFQVYVDDKEVMPEDRAYHDKVQYLWTYGNHGTTFAKGCKDLGKVPHGEQNPEARPADIAYTVARKNFNEKVSETEKKGENTEIGDEFVSCVRKLDGWIATSESSDQLKEEEGEGTLNRIVLLMRGKVAHENVLDILGFGGLFTKYMFGEIHADFLDDNRQEDAATSSRQAIKEDDPRFLAVKKWLEGELSHIESLWVNRRREDRVDKAMALPSVKNWFNALKKDEEKAAAKQLLEKVASVSLYDERNRATIYEYAILTFERIRFRNQVAKMEGMEQGSFEAFKEVFLSLSELEGALYRTIVEERLTTIRALSDKVHRNDLEKVIQTHLANNMWLLDPSWERATMRVPHVEERVATAFKKLNEQTAGTANRVDIRYQKVGGEHVIIELKRPQVQVEIASVQEQILRYRDELAFCLQRAGMDDGPIECIIIVGRLPARWENSRKAHLEGLSSLRELRIRIMTYDELLKNAQQQYSAFYNASTDSSEVAQIIDDVVEDLAAKTEQLATE